MEKKEMNFQIGKKYRMRNGEAAEFVGLDAVKEPSFKHPSGYTLFYEKNGHYYGSMGENDYDIISDTPVEEPIEYVPYTKVGCVMNFQIGKKYRMRNGETAEFVGEDQSHSYALKFYCDDLVMRTNYFGLTSIMGPSNCDIISDTPVEEETPTLNWAGQTVYDSTGAVVSGRRQFDVSKLPTRIHHASIYDEGKFDGEYFLKEKVLEAWNAGTIEELLEGWTK